MSALSDVEDAVVAAVADAHAKVAQISGKLDAILVKLNQAIADEDTTKLQAAADSLATLSSELDAVSSKEDSVS